MTDADLWRDENTEGMPDIPAEAYAAADAALDALPQPESRCERDRWRIVSHIALEAAAPILAKTPDVPRA